MAYEQQEWGTYQYDESKSFTENLAAAKAANALVTTDKIKHIEQGIADKAEKGDKGDPGTAGKNGSDAKQVKTAVLDEDVNGIVTGGTLTFTDNTTVPITVNKATA